MADETGREDQQFERYLLGLLPENEAERLDELSIADDDAAWRLSAVENDLVDAYVRGELDGETLQRFNSYYMASPRRRAKVMFARTLLLGVAGSAAAMSPAVAGALPAVARETRMGESATNGATGAAIGDAEPTRPRVRWIDRLFPGGNAPWSVLVAVAAMLLLVCGVLIVQDLRMRQAVMREEMNSAALAQRAEDLQRQLEAQRAANAGTVAELERLRAAGGTGINPNLPLPNTGGSRPDERTASNPSSSTLPSAVALALFPGMRGGGANATLTVPSATDRVSIDLRIEANDFSHYDAVLKDLATNQVVWRSGRLAAKVVADHTSVIVTIPASTLTPRRYALDLSGRHASGAGELISSYPFQVLGR